MTDTTFNCFLLTAGCRDSGRRFEITLWAAGESGARGRIFVDDFRPMFFCPRSVPAEETAEAAERKRLDMRAMDGGDVDCLYFNTYSLAQQTARKLRATGHRVFESDVNPLERYLMERMVSGSMAVTGASEPLGQFVGFKNPRVRGGTFTPELRVMAVCIDAGDDEAIREIACFDSAHSHVFTGNERKTLADFIAYVRLWDPDIITGWKVIDYTLRIISERCVRNGVNFDIGREPGSRVTSSERRRTWRDGYTSTKTVWTARVPGRVVMDVPAMLRAYHHSHDEYHLEFANALASAKSIHEIFNKAEVLQNAVERSKRSGQTLDGTGGSVASFDHLYLPRLHRAGYAALDTRDIAPPKGPLPGGHVLDPAPGLYDNVLVFDFKSLYPSIIMTFMIDPLGFNIKGNNRITGPVGTAFSKDVSILPEIISELMAARALAAERKNPYLSQAIKILMNSFYGVLGSTGCRFFSEKLSSTITLTGQYILKSSIERIEATSGKRVIYGDTDSIFVNLGEGMEDWAKDWGKTISSETGAWLSRHLKENFGAESKLELKYENHYHKFFIPSLRGGGDIGQGAKKHYCGAVVDGGGNMELTFKGMESARSDWTDLAKKFQRELFIKFFSGQPLDDYVISTASRLERGEYDDMLVYRKRMRKDINAYAVNVPPHVQAAKLLDRPARLVRYCVTKSGPQPVEKLSSPLDYQHYADSQLAPIADSILEWMGTSFDRLTSGQQDLFG